MFRFIRKSHEQVAQVIDDTMQVGRDVAQLMEDSKQAVTDAIHALNGPSELVDHAVAQLEHYADVAADATYTVRSKAEKIREDHRANKRNLNRLLTLFGALLIGLVLTYLLTNPAILMSLGMSPKLIKFLAPYTFVITILMDSSLALYSFIRKY